MTLRDFDSKVPSEALRGLAKSSNRYPENSIDESFKPPSPNAIYSFSPISRPEFIPSIYDRYPRAVSNNERNVRRELAI